METKVIKGELVQQKILAEVKTGIAELKHEFEKVPGIVFIGFEGVALAKYTIPLHVNLSESLGFKVYVEIMKENVTEGELFSLIDSYNRNGLIHAIVILQPVPVHLNAIKISGRISPLKEVEGFHPQNMLGTMVPSIQINKYPMCLPEALLEMLNEAGIEREKDQEWVFLLDDEFFENDLTRMIVHSAALKVVPNDCQVSFVNKASETVADHCRRADFLVVVTKYPEYVNPEWLKQGVCIIDVYSNLVKEVVSKNDPSKLVPVIRGGVNLETVKNKAGAILPIPGGLMTVVLAILFRNVLMAFRMSRV